MKLESKYDINQKVWHIHNVKEKKFIVCSACDGKGNIMLNNKALHNCPICHGNGGKNEYLDTKWQIDRSLTIGEVRVKIRNFEKGDMFDNIGSFAGEGKEKQETEYMAYETGIGSGNIWHEADLFPSQEEAQLECDRRNLEDNKQL